MLNKKIAGMLLIAALAGGLNAKADISDTATQNLECSLGTYLDIQAITDNTTLLTNITPSSGNLTESLVSKFQIDLNSDAQEIYLKATTASSNGDVNAFFAQNGQTYLIFSNTTSGKQPSTNAIDNCKEETPDQALNANAIAYPIEAVEITNDGQATYDGGNSRYTVNVNSGRTIATTKTGQIAYAGTYSYLDTAGTYRATLIMTATSL